MPRQAKKALETFEREGSAAAEVLLKLSTDPRFKDHTTASDSLNKALFRDFSHWCHENYQGKGKPRFTKESLRRAIKKLTKGYLDEGEGE